MFLGSSSVSYRQPLHARYLALLRFPRHDPAISPLVVTRLESARRLAPRRHRVPAAGGLTFAAAVRVVNRVHGDPTVVWAPPEPAAAAGLAKRHVFVVDIAN